MPRRPRPPRLLPARVDAAAAGSRLFLITLGDVETPLAPDRYDPSRDRLVRASGGAVDHYLRDVRGLRFYSPADPARFSAPPCGWCSWYFYYQDVDAVRILRNARWMARNLAPFGATVLQVDDGWQGAGRGRGDNRDWTRIDRRFARGMDVLAREIRALGLTPGLWIAPHGQSDPGVVAANPGAFILADGRSPSDSWVGKFIVDPTSPAGIRYLERLIRRVAGWGYDYLKVDGQPVVLAEYRAHAARMASPPSDVEEAYRGTLRAIRRAAGRRRFILGSWGPTPEAVGFFDGSRTADDVSASWPGFLDALDATMRWYFLHGIAWSCDPDVMLVRPPLTIGMARAWATLQGLTGQALFASDDMPDLSPARVEILKRVVPPSAARPVDLVPSDSRKRIWDLKVAHHGRRYDVVGVFNVSTDRVETPLLSWAELGLPDGPVHVFDFWAGEYLGSWPRGYFVRVPPASVRVLALLPDDGRPGLLSTSRHITQGWTEIEALARSRDGLRWRGRSRLVAGDPYELRFGVPGGESSFRVRAAAFGGRRAAVTNRRGWSTAAFTSARSRTVEWTVEFEPCAHPPADRAAAPGPIAAAWEPDGRLRLSWHQGFHSPTGFEVRLDGEVAGCSPHGTIWLEDRPRGRRLAVEVRMTGIDGRPGAEAARVVVEE